jgi:hypothetical protein
MGSCLEPESDIFPKLVLIIIKHSLTIGLRTKLAFTVSKYKLNYDMVVYKTLQNG